MNYEIKHRSDMPLTEKQIKDIKDIQNIAIDFRCNTLGAEKPDGMCFTVSWLLSIHLANHDFKNSIIYGLVDGKPENIDHFWIKVDYANGFTIDTTASQFNTRLNQNYYDVHFGEPIAKEGTPDEQEKQIRQNKCSLLLQTINIISNLHPIVYTSIKISIKAAIILLNDNKDDDREYFKIIYQSLEILKKQDFDELSNFVDLAKFLQLYRERYK